MIEIFSRDRDVKIAYLATAKFCQLAHSFSLFLRDVTGIAECLSPHKKLNRVGVIFVLFILMQGEPRVSELLPGLPCLRNQLFGFGGEKAVNYCLIYGTSETNRVFERAPLPR